MEMGKQKLKKYALMDTLGKEYPIVRMASVFKVMRQGKKHKVAFLNILKYFITVKGGILTLDL
jgi:hypothetical protein